MTKRKPLTWFDTDLGPIPGCATCADRHLNPTFIEAVYSVSIEHPGDPADLARRTTNRFHERRHVDA